MVTTEKYIFEHAMNLFEIHVYRVPFKFVLVEKESYLTTHNI